MDENTFMETIKSVAEIMRITPLSEDEIFGYFDDMKLDDSQKQLVLAYLMNPENKEEAKESDDGGMDTLKNLPEETAENDTEHPGKSTVFKMYLEELSYLPDYSREEKNQMYGALLQGEESVIKRISDAWLKNVLSIAEKYVEPKLMAEDLVQEGNMALFLKLKELCGSKDDVDVERVLEDAVEEGIMSYASRINGQRELENTILGKVNLVHEAKKLLTEEAGQAPTIEELSEYTKMSVEELVDIEDMMKTVNEK